MPTQTLDLPSLLQKLNALCRKSIEAAAGQCVAQTHYNVEIEHLLLTLLEQPDSDLQRLLATWGVESATLRRELHRSLAQLERGNGRTPTFSPQLLELLQEAWLLSSLQFGLTVIRSGTVLLALCESDDLRDALGESLPSLQRIPRAALRSRFWSIVQGSAEDWGAGSSVEARVTGSRPRPAQRLADHPARSTTPPSLPSEEGPLELYTVDLTAQAREGKIDPISGRDAEIRQIVDILLRRRQNNPILTGEAGVGKTAVVEGFALRVARGDVPPSLREISVRTLDLGLLQAGAGVRGEFENRLKAVIAAVKAAPSPIILFIDEAHNLIGAGNTAGQGDAANLLKPALARGEVRTIAATTWSEYKRYFEKDPALARRFQVVSVAEPSEEIAVAMLRGVAAALSEHHQVLILDEAIRNAVALSHRYITGRQLPDKAIGVLDTACARVAVGKSGTPAPLEEATRRLESLALEIAALERDQAITGSTAPRLADLQAERECTAQRQAALQSRWQDERSLVRQIQECQRQLAAAAPQPEVIAQLRSLEAQLGALQGNDPLVPVCVDTATVAAVISGWTGIPVGQMHADEIAALLSLPERMAGRVIGQDQALDTICRRLRTSGARLDDQGKPVGVFLLAGPSGVGKTETALALAELLYGGERSMITINMSEYQEAHSVSGLKGSPPGYVGFGSGGVLTEAVRRSPYSVVLLDEIEKAHPDVIDLFYQVFDKGRLEDGEGVVVDFSNTVILLTSNLGTEELVTRYSPGQEPPETATLVSWIRPALLAHFKPALLGRMVIVPYLPLDLRALAEIARLKLRHIQERVQASHQAILSLDESLPARIAARCVDTHSGARTIDQLLTQTLLPELSGALLERLARHESISALHVDFNEAGQFSFTVQG